MPVAVFVQGCCSGAIVVWLAKERIETNVGRTLLSARAAFTIMSLPDTVGDTHASSGPDGFCLLRVFVYIETHPSTTYACIHRYVHACMTCVSTLHA